MGALELDRLAGAFLGAGLITWLFVWLLRKILPAIAAIIAGNAACIAIVWMVFNRDAEAALSIYGIPQAAWLVIMLAAERYRREREPALIAAPPSTTAPVRPPRTGNFILNHWRGLYPLGVSYWLFGFIISVVSALGVMAIHAAFFSDDGYQPVRIFFTVACTWAFLVPLTVWQLVGVWRSASWSTVERRLGGKRAPWAAVAKLMIILGALRSVVAFAGSGFPELCETYRMAFMGDPSMPAYAMRIMRNGTEVETTGGFKYGLTDDFKTLLKASPQLAVLHLDSIGGRIGEAIKLNRVIRQAGLKTYVSHQCASACTVAFSGGTERWIGEDGVLGFHGPAFPGVSQGELSAASRVQRDVMVSSGYDALFVDKALAVPSEDLWQPTVRELRAAHVVTSVSNGTQFAQSGYGGTIERDHFADLLARDVPILAPLRARYPADFDMAIEAYYAGYVDGQTDEQNNDIIRYRSYLAVRKYARSAGDDAVIELGRLLLDELAILRDRNAGQCAKFGNFGGGDPNIQYSFPKQIMARFQAAGAHVIETSTGTPVEDKEQIVALLGRTLAEMSGQFPELQLALLPGGHPTAQQAPEYCTAVIGYYQQLLKAPPTEAAAMLRVLMTL